MDQLDPATTVVLVIDLQWQYINSSSPVSVADGEDLVDRTNMFLDGVRERGARVLYTASWLRPGVASGRTTQRFPYKELNRDNWATLADRIEPKAGEVSLKKPRQSAFFATDLDPILRSFRCESVVISGVTSNVCCFATAVDAAARDYRVVWAHDLIKALPITRPGFDIDAETVHHNTSAMIAYSIGDVVSSEQILGALATT